MKAPPKKTFINLLLFMYIFFPKINIYSQSPCISSTVKFGDYISKMNLDVPLRINDGIEKVNLTIFDFNENITVDTTNVKIIDSFLSIKNSLTHADKTLIIIKKFINKIVSITHINSNTSKSQNILSRKISYMTELEKSIENAQNGDILFLVFNNTNFDGPKEQNLPKLKLFKKAIDKNVIVIESAGNENTNNFTDNDISTIVVGGAIPANNMYHVAECSNFGKPVDIYGPSGINIKNDIFFYESSSGSTVITSMAVRLQYECKLSIHKFLDAYEMKDIFLNANSILKVIETNGVTKQIPQYLSLLNYAKVKYFDKRR